MSKFTMWDILRLLLTFTFFSGCKKVDQCFSITHLVMFQKLFNLRLLVMFPQRGQECKI